MPYWHTSQSIDASLLPADSVAFTNCRLCINGCLTPRDSVLIASEGTGEILELHSQKPTHVYGGGEGQVIDLRNAILAPGFLELQTNGMRGFHFTHFEDEESYARKVEEVASYLPTQGVTGFWATVPTVESSEFKKVSNSLLHVYARILH